MPTPVPAHGEGAPRGAAADHAQQALGPPLPLRTEGHSELAGPVKQPEPVPVLMQRGGTPQKAAAAEG